MGVNSDPGARRQRTAGASDLSLQCKMDLKVTWALRDIGTLKGSPSLVLMQPACTPPHPQRRLTGHSPQGAPEAYITLVAERLRAAPKEGLRWAPACTPARPETVGRPHHAHSILA